MARKNTTATVEPENAQETFADEAAAFEKAVTAGLSEDAPLDAQIASIMADRSLNMVQKIEKAQELTAAALKAERKAAKAKAKETAQADTAFLTNAHVQAMVDDVEKATGRVVVYASVKFTPSEGGPIVKSVIRTRKATEAEIAARTAAVIDSELTDEQKASFASE